MTAQSWRELAIERIAESDWKNYGYAGVYPTWESLPLEQKKVWRRGARATVDALGDLAPTEVEFLVYLGARRFVTVWLPTPDEQPVDLCAALQQSLDAVKAEQAARDDEVTR